MSSSSIDLAGYPEVQTLAPPPIYYSQTDHLNANQSQHCNSGPAAFKPDSNGVDKKGLDGLETGNPAHLKHQKPKFGLWKDSKQESNATELTVTDDETVVEAPPIIKKPSKTSNPSIQRRPSIIDLGLKVKDLSKSVKMAAEDELRYEALRFAHSTTAHGIPMALSSTRWYARGLWMALSLFSAGIFIYQCVLVFDKFQKKDKIVSVALQFEQAAFPAITICSLNPFKNSLARKVPEISETLDAFHQAVTYSKDAAQHYVSSSRDRRNAPGTPGGFRYVQYEPVMSDCECEKAFPGKIPRADCIQKDTIPKDNITLCICNYDRQDSTVWPCYNVGTWMESMCPDCNDIGYCNLPETNGTNVLPCICQKNVHYCLLRPDRLKRMWEIRGNRIPEEDSPFRDDFLAQLKELGYENMTDEVAITTKTKERLVLTMAGLPVQRRIALSYGKSEFIRMCSFNGQQCDIINDFKLHVDPAFGNCYTFNANKDKPLVSSRAGPSYGLRLLVFINSSDYLPTTHSSGVRIAIHSPEEWPFPDSFGYSAPTDAVSSFGLSLKKVNRLSMPGGECVATTDPLPSDYIYQNYKYEPEGCYKSCYQNRIIRYCGCADPRYPVAKNDTKLCDSLDPLSRNCLIVEGIRFTRHHLCRCMHPCSHDAYTTTFSSAKLTSNAFKGSRCEGLSAKQCLREFDSNSAAMLEIYYEQMSYEILSESESYLFVNFMSDVGGQAGLWLGASILTLFEIIVFALRILTIFCRRKCRGGASIINTDFGTSDFSTHKHNGNVKRVSSTITNISSDPKFEFFNDDSEEGGKNNCGVNVEVATYLKMLCTQPDEDQLAFWKVGFFSCMCDINLIKCSFRRIRKHYRCFRTWLIDILLHQLQVLRASKSSLWLGMFMIIRDPAYLRIMPKS
uniref:Uncharacterized protein n=1 Tax=Ditylenchus dipsaci TaxID=166011 RepID=A0A915CMF8_9BILA